MALSGVAVTDEQIMAAAKALYERDARHSIGFDTMPYVWERVRKEYEAAAREALTAAEKVEMPF